MTSVSAGKYDLSIILNPDKFLCEGKHMHDAKGNVEWVKTPFLTLKGTPVYRQACNFTANYELTNKDAIAYEFKGRAETLVTSACKRVATVSPTKDCGFKLARDMLKCRANKKKTIVVRNAGAQPVVVRLCESSAQLGHSVFCEYKNNLANKVLNAGEQVNVMFRCPAYRDASEPGGLYSILASPLVPKTALSTIFYSNI